MGVTWGNKLRIAAVVDGFVIPHATVVEQYGGRDVSELLDKMLCKKHGVVIKFANQRSAVQKLKEKYSYVASVFDNELKLAATPEGKQCLNVPFVLPPITRDGKSCFFFYF